MRHPGIHRDDDIPARDQSCGRAEINQLLVRSAMLCRSRSIVSSAGLRSFCRLTNWASWVISRVFADVEAYGVARWLGELALALREESYQPDPIRVFIPKTNGKLRPLGISMICVGEAKPKRPCSNYAMSWES